MAQKQYGKLNIQMYDRSLVVVSGANVILSSRRRVIENGGDLSKLSSTVDGKTREYDYLVVQTNGIFLKFPINLAANNKSLKRIIEEKYIQDGKEVYPLLKFSGSLEVTKMATADGRPNTMTAKFQNDQGQTVEMDMPIFEARVVGTMQLSLASTNSLVEHIYADTPATQKMAEPAQDQYDEDMPPEDPSEDMPEVAEDQEPPAKRPARRRTRKNPPE